MKEKIKKIGFWILTLLIFGLSLTLSNQSLAATSPEIPCDQSVIGCGNNADDIENHRFFITFIPTFLRWLMGLSAGAAVLMGVMAGAMFLYSGDQEELRGRAQKTLTYALVGLGVSIFAYFIVEVINSLGWT